jgi:hypothetical protein
MLDVVAGMQPSSSYFRRSIDCRFVAMASPPGASNTPEAPSDPAVLQHRGDECALLVDGVVRSQA